MYRLSLWIIGLIAGLLIIKLAHTLQVFEAMNFTGIEQNKNKIVRPVKMQETITINALGEEIHSYKIIVNDKDIIYHSYEEFIGTTFVQYRLKTTNIGVKDIEYFDYLKYYEDALTEPKIYPLIREDNKKVMFGFVIDGEFTKAMTLEEAKQFKIKLIHKF